MASDIQNGRRCTIQQLSFEVIQMELGKNSDTAGQGSGKAGCAGTAGTGCGGELHNTNDSSTAGITLSITKLRKLTKIVFTPGKAHNHWGAIPNKFADVMKAWSTLEVTVE